MAPFTVSGIVVDLGLLHGLVFDVDVLGTQIRVTGALVIVTTHVVGAYPFVIRNVAPLLARLDGRLVESAHSLGTTRTRAFMDIELPLAWTGVVMGMAFTVATSIDEFDSTTILTEGAGSYAIPVTVKRSLGRQLDPTTAVGCLLLLVTSTSSLVVDRFGDRWSEL